METCPRHNTSILTRIYVIFVDRVGASQVVFIKFIITLHYSLIQIGSTTSNICIAT